MTNRLPIGVDDFAELVSPQNRYHFVDKSLFIKDILLEERRPIE